MANQPSHNVFYAKDIEGSDKKKWIELGAAWETKSGGGYNVELDVMPPSIDGKYRFVLLKNEPREGEQSAEVS